MGTKADGTGYVPDLCQSLFDSISLTGIPELTRGTSGTILLATNMNKTPEDDELRPHYDFDYTKMKLNRFAGVKKVYKESTIPTKATRKSRHDSKK